MNGPTHSSHPILSPHSYRDVDALDQQAGVEREAAGAVDCEELPHLVQTLAQNRLEQTTL